MFSKALHDKLVKLDNDRVVDLDFIESTHTYLYEGKELKSITTLLSEKGIAPSYENVNQETLLKAQEHGIKVHKAIEEWIKFNKETDCPELVNFIKWLDTNNYQVIGSECIVHNDTCAGTIDLILLDTKTRQVIIADIKTTSVIHIDSVEWQTSCYAYLDTFVAKEWGGYDKTLCLHFLKNGELEIKELHFKNKYAVESLVNLGIMPVVELDPQVVSIVVNAIKTVGNLKSQIDKYQAIIDSFNEKLIQAMEENSVKTFENSDVRITYVAPIEKKTLDTKALREKYGDIVKQFERTTITKPSVRIKVRNNEEETKD